MKHNKCVCYNCDMNRGSVTGGAVFLGAVHTVDIIHRLGLQTKHSARVDPSSVWNVTPLQGYPGGQFNQPSLDATP